MESQTFECPTCLLYFPGLDNFQKHVNSVKHALMVNLKNSGSVTDDDKIEDQIEPLSLACKICQKRFTGTVPYDQHMKSAIHLKNNSMIENSNQNCQAKLLKCDICEKFFSGSIPYDQHMVSNTHKKKIKAKHLSETIENINMSFGIAQATNNEYNDNYKTVIQSSSSAVAVYRCDICDKDFTGIIPYDQHQKSNVHKKKVQLKEMMKKTGNLFLVTDSKNEDKTDELSEISMKVSELKIAEPKEVGKINQVPNYFLELSCKICDKQFSGPMPLEQHMTSEIHKKNILENQTVKNTSTQCFESYKACDLSSSVGKLSCEVCNKCFNGPIPLQMHLNSNTHKKKVLVKEASKRMNDCNWTMVPDSTNDNEIEMFDGNSLELEEKSGAFGINQICQESNSDLILEHLNVIN